MEKSLLGCDDVGPLRVGSTVTIGSQFLPCYVDTFQNLRPQTRVQVCISPGETLEQRLLHNELDLALIEGGVHSHELIAEPYLEDTLLLICAPGRPFASGQTVTLEQLRGQPFLLREKGSATRETFDAAALAAGFSVEPAWEASSTTALVNAAINGLGIAVLPHRMIQGALERGLVVTLGADCMDFRRSFYIIHHKDKYLTPTANAFLDLCRSYEMDYPLPQYSGLF